MARLQLQSSWLRLGLLNLCWPAAQAALQSWVTRRYFLPGFAWLGWLFTVPIAALILRYAVRIVISNGIVAISYPFRLPPKTYLLLTDEVRKVEVRTGWPNSILFYLDEHRQVGLPFYGLPASAITRLKNALHPEAPDQL
jgi:hypothetical protein